MKCYHVVSRIRYAMHEFLLVNKTVVFVFLLNFHIHSFCCEDAIMFML